MLLRKQKFHFLAAVPELNLNDRIGDIQQTNSTPQLPFKEPQIPSNTDHKALSRGALGGLENGFLTMVTEFMFPNSNTV